MSRSRPRCLHPFPSKPNRKRWKGRRRRQPERRRGGAILANGFLLSRDRSLKVGQSPSCALALVCGSPENSCGVHAVLCVGKRWRELGRLRGFFFFFFFLDRERRRVRSGSGASRPNKESISVIDCVCFFVPQLRSAHGSSVGLLGGDERRPLWAVLG